MTAIYCLLSGFSDMYLLYYRTYTRGSRQGIYALCMDINEFTTTVKKQMYTKIKAKSCRVESYNQEKEGERVGGRRHRVILHPAGYNEFPEPGQSTRTQTQTHVESLEILFM
eukprot:GHVR01080632.1.p1 GENE.GHVR01080632.1~~GHVR01080632.1.p1  ORF type:complete len:112 (-),score=7.99 GHVR01080632.1:597-932(-)